MRYYFYFLFSEWPADQAHGGSMSKGLNVFFVVLRAKEDYLTSWVFKYIRKMVWNISKVVILISHVG